MASSPYARQVLCVGDKAHRRLSNAAVLVVGLGGVGAETGAPTQAALAPPPPLSNTRACAAKNLVLSGVRAVALHDDEAAQLDDLSAQACAGVARARSRARCRQGTR
jgi:molybdopterin/thiamine biosynthesis adenylyltransferase